MTGKSYPIVTLKGLPCALVVQHPQRENLYLIVTKDFRPSYPNKVSSFDLAIRLKL